jgi:hypothetical protein
MSKTEFRVGDEVCIVDLAEDGDRELDYTFGERGEVVDTKMGIWDWRQQAQLYYLVKLDSTSETVWCGGCELAHVRGLDD